MNTMAAQLDRVALSLAQAGGIVAGVGPRVREADPVRLGSAAMVRLRPGPGDGEGRASVRNHCG